MANSLDKGIEQWLSFIYTTHPYLDCPPNMVLNGIQLCPAQEDVDHMIETIKSGHIVMRAGAMNLQYGMMNYNTVKLAQQMY